MPASSKNPLHRLTTLSPEERAERSYQHFWERLLQRQQEQRRNLWSKYKLLEVSYLPRIYFLHSTANDFIKIGISEDIPARIENLRRKSPVPVQVLATQRGDYDREASYHRSFRKARSHGEWFRPTRDLLEVVAKVRAQQYEEKRAWQKVEREAHNQVRAKYDPQYAEQIRATRGSREWYELFKLMEFYYQDELGKATRDRIWARDWHSLGREEQQKRVEAQMAALLERITLGP